MRFRSIATDELSALVVSGWYGGFPCGLFEDPQRFSPKDGKGRPRGLVFQSGPGHGRNHYRLHSIRWKQTSAEGHRYERRSGMRGGPSCEGVRRIAAGQPERRVGQRIRVHQERPGGQIVRNAIDAGDARPARLLVHAKSSWTANQPATANLELRSGNAQRSPYGEIESRMEP